MRQVGHLLRYTKMQGQQKIKNKKFVNELTTEQQNVEIDTPLGNIGVPYM